MKKQCFNPYLPDYEYVPDGEPHVFGNRLYIYGSHDQFNGKSFCLNDYVCWSADVNDLSEWRYEGVIYARGNDPLGKRGAMHAMYAPDVCRGADGRYYLYYSIAYSGLISVAVCDTPAGKYRFLGRVRYADGTLLGERGEPLQFDPAVYADDDGKFYLYTGFAPLHYPKILLGGRKPTRCGAMGFELESDMLTVRGGLNYIGVRCRADGRGTAYEGHEFFEAPSLRKFEGRYYFIYSSFVGHELCYAVSDRPLGGFGYGGTLVSIGDVGIGGNTSARNYTGNTHGSIVQIGGAYMVFYHRQTNRHCFSRQGCAERITMKDGAFEQARLTSCGLNGAPLAGHGEYPASIACLLYSKKGTYFYGVVKRRAGVHPYFTQTGGDREGDPDQYIANMRDGAVAVYRYFNLTETRTLALQVSGRGGGAFCVFDDDTGEPLGEIRVPSGKGKRTVGCAVAFNGGCAALAIKYAGQGRVNVHKIILE